MEVLAFLSNIKHYISLDFKILICIQCGLVLNNEFGVEFNVHVFEEILHIVNYFISIQQAFTEIWF